MSYICLATLRLAALIMIQYKWFTGVRDVFSASGKRNRDKPTVVEFYSV